MVSSILSSKATGQLSLLTFGSVFKYNSNYPSKYINGDSYISTWADDGNIYTTMDDTTGWQAATNSNMAISQLSNITTSMTGTLVNAMSGFGAAQATGSDGATYKSGGLISVNGTLYCFATRQIYGNSGNGNLQTALSSQLLLSANHGSTWTPQPPSTAQPYASPMFASANFAVPSFIQYGQDYKNNFADNSATYVYALSTDGAWNNGNHLYLGRVKISLIGNLSASDWSFWTGGDGMSDANWSSTLGSAIAVLTNTGKIGTATIQYLPVFGRYLLLTWYYPAPGTHSNSFWLCYEAPHPWGPWTLFQSTQWTPKGFYNPCIMPKSVATDGGITCMITTAGDFDNTDPQTGDYTLTLVPVTISAN